MNVSFAMTTEALLAGKKMCTRRRAQGKQGKEMEESDG